MSSLREYSGLPDKALSIRQPWAWAIIHASKRMENRTWQTAFRGPICIHASKGMTKDEYLDASGFIQRQGFDCPDAPRLERGGIIGTATLVNCYDKRLDLWEDDPWFFGPWGLFLKDVKPVPFIPVKGALGIFDWKGRVITDA